MAPPVHIGQREVPKKKGTTDSESPRARTRVRSRFIAQLLLGGAVLVVGFTVADLTHARRDKGGVAPTFDAPIGIVGNTSTLPINVTYLAVLDRNTDVVAEIPAKPHKR